MVLSARLKNIKDMFGQIPDTLEDVWIDVALNNIEEAKERIDRVPEQNPFTIKYETKIPATEDWAACTFVLDIDEKLKAYEWLVKYDFQGKTAMIGINRLETQVLPDNGKFEHTGLGSDRDTSEATNTAFNYLKANGHSM
jgi:hypothetical protein